MTGLPASIQSACAATLVAVVACGSPSADQAVRGTTGSDPRCTPVETREPNAPEQRPAFEGQTRACAEPTDVAFDVLVLATGLEQPWAVEPLPAGDLLVTEKPGRLRIVSAGGELGAPIAGVPEVDDRGQGGLLDVALSPGFESDRTIFWSFSEPRPDGNATSVARGVLSPDRRRLGDVRVIFRAMPAWDGGLHFGSRLVFDRDGMLFVTLGERSDTRMRPQAQRLDSHMGKVLRIAPDGAPAPGNPFAGIADNATWNFTTVSTSTGGKNNQTVNSKITTYYSDGTTKISKKGDAIVTNYEEEQEEEEAHCGGKQPELEL